MKTVKINQTDYILNGTVHVYKLWGAWRVWAAERDFFRPVIMARFASFKTAWYFARSLVRKGY